MCSIFVFDFFFHPSLCSYIHNELQVAVVGPKVDLTYDCEVRRAEMWGGGGGGEGEKGGKSNGGRAPAAVQWSLRIKDTLGPI